MRDMGTQIWKIIPKNCIKNVKLADLRGKTVLFDTNNLIFRFIFKIRDKHGNIIRNKSGFIISHILSLLHYISTLYEMQVKAIFVIDGAPNELKHKNIDFFKTLTLHFNEPSITKFSRRLTVNEYNLIIEQTMQLLKLSGYPTLIFTSEAEKTAAMFSKKMKDCIVVTNDYDSLLFGAKVIIRNFNISGKEMQLINLDCVLKKLEITKEQLVDIAILSSTDFNKGVKGVGVKKAYKLIKKYGAIENIPNMNIDRLKEIREIFNRDIDINQKIYYSAPQVEGLLRLLLGFGISEKIAKNIVSNIRKSYEVYKYRENTLLQFLK